MTTKKNLFIAFEGIDGSGKSTQVNLLAERLKQEGHKVYTTREPTDGPIGSIIRDIMKGKMEADHRIIAGLFVADRLDHLLNETNGILLKLKEGYTVITDRYYFSSYAYHGAHMSMDWVIDANAMSAEILRPDLNIYIDIDPDISMNRLNNGRSATELYETTETQQVVREKYLEAIEKLKLEENIFLTDGNRPLEAVAADIWKEVSTISVGTI